MFSRKKCVSSMKTAKKSLFKNKNYTGERETQVHIETKSIYQASVQMVLSDPGDDIFMSRFVDCSIDIVSTYTGCDDYKL